MERKKALEIYQFYYSSSSCSCITLVSYYLSFSYYYSWHSKFIFSHCCLFVFIWFIFIKLLYYYYYKWVQFRPVLRWRTSLLSPRQGTLWNPRTRIQLLTSRLAYRDLSCREFMWVRAVPQSRTKLIVYIFF